MLAISVGKNSKSVHSFIDSGIVRGPQYPSATFQFVGPTMIVLVIANILWRFNLKFEL